MLEKSLMKSAGAFVDTHELVSMQSAWVMIVV